MSDLIFSGLGGQGVLYRRPDRRKNPPMEQGRHVTWIPSYGSEMRGGVASCNLRISDSIIGSPFADHPHLLLAMDEGSVSRFLPTLRADGTLLYDST